MENKQRAKNNRTVTLTNKEIEPLRQKLLTENNITANTDVINKTIHGDFLSTIKYIPDECADLISIDPPYNLSKNFNGMKLNSRPDDSYDEYLATWFPVVATWKKILWNRIKRRILYMD